MISPHAWQRLEPPSGSKPAIGVIDSEVASKKDADTWDVFICHAGEDKNDVVEPLARALFKLGLRVWYDRWVLTIGDSLRRKIDDGLANSRYGIVVLSAAFFGKGWPERELDGLVQREVHGRKVILPVWHRVTRDDVARYSLPLADKVAGSTATGIDQLADELLRAMRTEPASSTPRIPAPITLEERWVDIDYPRDSGLLGRLQAAGYTVKWCFDNKLARAIDLEGWEYVYQDLDGDKRAILRLRDRPDNQTLIMRRVAQTDLTCDHCHHPIPRGKERLKLLATPNLVQPATPEAAAKWKTIEYYHEECIQKAQ